METYNCRDMYRFYRKEKGTLSYEVFKSIIAENNKLNSLLIIGGYQYEIPHKIGLIHIIRGVRKIFINKNGNVHGAVNWKASNQLKQEIIDRGELPYKAEVDKDLNVISDNGGEKWLVYYTDECYYAWNKISGVFLHNAMKYRFSPTWSNLKALNASITEDSDLLYNNVTGNKNGTSRDYLNKILAAKSRDDVRIEG